MTLRLKKKLTGFTPGALQLMQAHGWPGNIRELENAVERAAILTKGELITADALPQWKSQSRSEAKEPDRLVPLETVEREHILHVLKRTGYNKSRAAGILGIARRTLDRKIEEIEQAAAHDAGDR